MRDNLGHDRYVSGDEDIPGWLKDLAGSPMFPVCRTCGGFEADLRFTCPGDGSEDAGDAATAAPERAGSALQIANAKLFKMKFQFEHSPAVIGMNGPGEIYMSGKYTADELRQILEVMGGV